MCFHVIFESTLRQNIYIRRVGPTLVVSQIKNTLPKHTRWAPTTSKWSYNPFKWPYKWVTGVISPL